MGSSGRPLRAILAGAALALVACGRPETRARSDTSGADRAVSSAVRDTARAADADSVTAPVPRSACRAVGTRGVPASDRELRAPASADGILGIITQVRAPFGQVESFRIRVEQEPSRSAGTPQADILVSPATPVVQRVGHRASPAELRVCEEVRVWFDGPVAESFPVQARARFIVIERMLERVPER